MPFEKLSIIVIVWDSRGVEYLINHAAGTSYPLINVLRDQRKHIYVRLSMLRGSAIS